MFPKFSMKIFDTAYSEIPHGPNKFDLPRKHQCFSLKQWFSDGQIDDIAETSHISNLVQITTYNQV